MHWMCISWLKQSDWHYRWDLGFIKDSQHLKIRRDNYVANNNAPNAKREKNSKMENGESFKICNTVILVGAYA